MAHGYAMVTGRPQAMMVHVGVGTANSLNGLINASRQNVPILFTAGRTPITEGRAAARLARNNYIHWAQEHFDQGGMLREFVKWDYELRHAEQVGDRDRPRARHRQERAAGPGVPDACRARSWPRTFRAEVFRNLDHCSRLPARGRPRGAGGSGQAPRRAPSTRCIITASGGRTRSPRARSSSSRRRWRFPWSTTGRAISRSPPSTRCIAAGTRTRCSRKPTSCWSSTATCRGSRRKASPSPTPR